MRRFGMTGVLALAAAVCGCSWQSAGWEGVRIGKNVSRKDSHLKIWLDDQPAEQNTLKKAMSGYSRWRIKEQVGTSPKLKFEIEEPERFGRITMVSVSIHQQFEADYSHQAEFTIFSKSQEPADQMKPDTVYDFGKMPAGFKIINLTGKEVDKVDLKPGLKYQMSLTVKADRSETGLIEFKAK